MNLFWYFQSENGAWGVSRQELTGYCGVAGSAGLQIAVLEGLHIQAGLGGRGNMIHMHVRSPGVLQELGTLYER